MKVRYVLLIVSGAALLVGAVFLLAFFNGNRYYSMKLVRAIRNEDLTEVREIVEKKPGCINTVPTIAPKWWRILMETPARCPLSEACIADHPEMVRLLLEHGADPSGCGSTIPLSAVYTRKQDHWYEISLLLIEAGADINYVTAHSAGKPFMMMDIVSVRPGAALEGYVPDDPEQVKAAFCYAMKNCDLTRTDWRWVLQESICNSRIEITKYLLENGYCDVNDTEGSETSPLMFAARSSNAEMVRLLLEFGADKDYVTPEGATAFGYAVQFDNTEEVIDLLRN